ncbi:MAG: outer membrane beta-barrel protein [bacterium]
MRIRKRASAILAATITLTFILTFILILTLTLTVGFLILDSPPCRAEKFADLSIGGSFSTDENLTISAPREKATGKVSFSNSFIVGYRLGYWFESQRWAGVAVDASLFRQDIDDDGSLEVIPVSTLLMLRLPLLKSHAHPRGAFWPYVGLGPGIFFSSIEYEVADSDIPALLGKRISGTYSDREADIGLDARAGFAIRLPRHIAIFSEYRYTRFDPDFKEDVLGVKVNLATELKTHHLLCGFTCFF